MMSRSPFFGSDPAGIADTRIHARFPRLSSDEFLRAIPTLIHLRFRTARPSFKSQRGCAHFIMRSKIKKPSNPLLSFSVIPLELKFFSWDCFYLPK